MRDTLAIILIVLAALGFYAFTLRGVSGNIAPGEIKGRLDTVTKPFELSPERGRFAGVLSLAERGTYDLGRELAEVVYPDVGYYENRFYSFFAPGMAYLALPFYQLGSQLGFGQLAAYAFVSLSAIACLVFIYLIGRRILNMPVWLSILAPIIYAFASTSWSYAITLYQHHLTSLFIYSGFYAAWKYGRRGRFSWIWGVWVWTAYGLAISIDYPNVVLMLPVIGYFILISLQALKSNGGIKLTLRPAILAASVFFIAIMLGNMRFNQENFGSWKRLAGQLPGFALEQEIVALDSQELVEEAAAGKGLVSFFSDTNIPKSFYTLFFSFDRGLLVFSPIMLLGLLGMFKARKLKGFEKYFLMAIIASSAILYSSWGDPWGGWAYGPRYLIPSMASLSLFASYWLFEIEGRVWPKIAALVLIAYSSGIALLGAVTSNAVPPNIEAVNLPVKYSNFLYNLLLLNRNESGSFVYNTYFLGKISLLAYFLIIYGILLLFFILLIFIAPKLSGNKKKIYRYAFNNHQ